MVLLQAAARLDRARFRVFAGLLTPDRENLLPPQITPIDFNLPGLNGWVWLRFFLHLCWVLVRYRIEIIHTNSYVPGNYARLAAAALRVPVIIDHWHGFSHFNRKRRLICRGLGQGHRPEPGRVPGGKGLSHRAMPSYPGAGQGGA